MAHELLSLMHMTGHMHVLGCEISNPDRVILTFHPAASVKFEACCLGGFEGTGLVNGAIWVDPDSLAQTVEEGRPVMVRTKPHPTSAVQYFNAWACKYHGSKERMQKQAVT